VLLTNVVVRPDPFHWAVAPLTNPVPVTVSVKDEAPSCTAPGLRPVMAGIGLVTLKAGETTVVCGGGGSTMLPPLPAASCWSQLAVTAVPRLPSGLTGRNDSWTLPKWRASLDSHTAPAT
jgi:hypothetical protein